MSDETSHSERPIENPSQLCDFECNGYSVVVSAPAIFRNGFYRAFAFRVQCQDEQRAYIRNTTYPLDYSDAKGLDGLDVGDHVLLDRTCDRLETLLNRARSGFSADLVRALVELFELDED